MEALLRPQLPGLENIDAAVFNASGIAAFPLGKVFAVEENNSVGRWTTDGAGLHFDGFGAGVGALGWFGRFSFSCFNDRK